MSENRRVYWGLGLCGLLLAIIIVRSILSGGDPVPDPSPAPVQPASVPAENTTPGDVRAATLQSIRESLGRDDLKWDDVEEVQPRFETPFLGTPRTKMYAVTHEFPVGDPGQRQPSRILFSPGGKFVRAESRGRVDDPRRMSVDLVEQAMQNGDERFVRLGSDREVDLEAFWKRVVARFPMLEAKEFQLTVVEIESSYEDLDGPLVVATIWGLDNPLQMPESLPAEVRNRIRVYFDLQGNVLRSDNLL